MNAMGGRQGSFESWKEGEALLEHMSFPPTDEELANMPTLSPAQLPPKYTRSNAGRVFVNRSLRLDRISWVGCTCSLATTCALPTGGCCDLRLSLGQAHRALTSRAL
jgi:hypothetical protein